MTNGVSRRPPTSFLKGPDTGCVPPRGKSTGRGGETFFRLSNATHYAANSYDIRHSGAPENGSFA